MNEQLVSANHTIRRIEDVLNSLRGSKYSCVLEVYKAYLHLQIDESSSKIQMECIVWTNSVMAF